LPKSQSGLIGFNDRFCRSAVELRSVILKARAIAFEEAEHERAAPAFKRRLLAELGRDRAGRGDKAPAEMPMPGSGLQPEPV
jgi:hypothetical protein